MEWVLKHFSELTTEELYDVLKLRSEVFVMEQNCVYLDCDGKDKDAYHLFGVEGNEVAAYVRLLKRGVSYEEASIGRVLVNQKHRGKGLAREVMVKAIDFLEEEWKETEIRISAQEYLLDFYESVGFQPVSEVYIEDDIPHVEMLYKMK